MIKDIIRALGFRRLALVASVATPLILSFSASAQSNPASAQGAPTSTTTTAPGAGSTAEAERVVVTGSNIPTAEEVTASPIDTITPQEINRTGSQEVLSVLQKRNPNFTGGGNLGVSNANIASGATLGGSTISIRGFPTLVLYEGRRLVDSAAVAAGGIQFSDVALFPAALISRIEVLKDGASAIYGSEAVGGVVNIFTKDDFQGAEVGFRYGTTLEGAVAERRGYAIGGVSSETTSITAGMQYYEIDPLFERQRDYSALTINGTTTYAGAVRSDATGATPSGRYLIIGETPLNFPGPVIANSPFDPALGAGTVVPGSIPGASGYAAIPQVYRPSSTSETLTFNLGRVPTSTLDTARTNVVASIDHQVFGKQLELFGNFLYSNSDYHSLLNAQPLSNGTGVIVPAGRPGLSASDPGFIAGVNNAIFNPFDTQIDSTTLVQPGRLTVANRYTFAPRIFDNENNFYRFLGGIRSQITPDWNFESAAYYSKYDISFVNRNLVQAPILNDLIANGGLDFFAVNPIGTGPGQVSQSTLGTIFGSNIRELSSFQRVFDAKLTGFPFELPAGKVGIAVGAEARQEGFKLNDSPEVFVGSVPVGDIDRKRDIYSVYAEVSIPVVSAKMKIPGVYSFDIDLAGRYDHYEGVNEDAKVPKIALRYQPIKDVTLRATYSNSFIAPNLFQQFGPPGNGFTNAITLNGNVQDQAQISVITNRALVPATAENYTAGIVVSPRFVPGLTITADYFRTLEQGVISGFGGNLILQSVNKQGINSQFQNRVFFGNFPGQPGSQTFAAIAAQNAITDPTNPNGVNLLDGNLSAVFVTDQLQNLGAIHTEGLDLSLDYTIDLKQFGQLELGINSIVYFQYEQKTSPDSNYFNLLGLDSTEGLGVIPDYKLTFLAEYRWQGFTASIIANYIPKVLNAAGHDPETEDQKTFQEVQDYLEFDGRLSYTFERKGDMTTAAAVADNKDSKSVRDGKDKNPAPVAGATLSVLDRLLNGTTLAVGCNNIFDRTPSFVDGANSNTDLSVYDPYGRFLYFEIAKKF